MEAIAYNNQAIRFNNMLQTGMPYDFNLVGFTPMEIPNGHFWYLAMDFVVTLHVRTEIMMSAQRITSTIFPRASHGLKSYSRYGTKVSLVHNL